mgnify:CR=1 FL=1
MADAAQFRVDLDKFVKNVVPQRAAEIQRNMSLELFSSVVLGTPVGNHRKWERNLDRATRGLPPLPKGYVGGHARKNWQIRIGSPNVRELAGQDNGGQRTISAGLNEIRKVKRKPVRLFIVNPLPYIDPLERGHSKQAPNGWIRRAIQNVSAKYRRKS